jgi:hypothetical protein
VVQIIECSNQRSVACEDLYLSLVVVVVGGGDSRSGSSSSSMDQQGTENMRNKELGFDSTSPVVVSQTYDQSKLVLFNGTGTGYGTFACCFFPSFVFSGLLRMKDEAEGAGLKTSTDREARKLRFSLAPQRILVRPLEHDTKQASPT